MATQVSEIELSSTSNMLPAAETFVTRVRALFEGGGTRQKSGRPPANICATFSTTKT